MQRNTYANISRDCGNFRLLLRIFIYILLQFATEVRQVEGKWDKELVKNKINIINILKQNEMKQNKSSLQQNGNKFKIQIQNRNDNVNAIDIESRARNRLFVQWMRSLTSSMVWKRFKMFLFLYCFWVTIERERLIDQFNRKERS